MFIENLGRERNNIESEDLCCSAEKLVQLETAKFLSKSFDLIMNFHDQKLLAKFP